MPNLNKPRLLLTAALLAAISGVPLLQAVMELAGRELPKACDLVRRAPTPANLRAYEKNLEEASWLTNQARPMIQFARFALLGDVPEKVLPGRDGWFFYCPAVQYLVEPWPPRPGAGKAAENPLPAIVAFRDELACRGIKLLVVAAPNKASVYPEMLAARAKDADPPVHAHTLDLLSRLRTVGVELVDLHSVYSRARASGSPALYLARDTHWTPAGMELAAEAIAGRLLERGWLAEGTVEYRLETSDFRRLGDLLQMMQTPAIERLYEPEAILCRCVVGNDGKPYRDDPASQVLVMGDSFLRTYERSEPRFYVGETPRSAGFIAHLSYRLRRPVASIVVEGGASTLVRQQLYGKPRLLENKKVVVWEFVERDIRFGEEGWQRVPLPKQQSPGCDGPGPP